MTQRVALVTGAMGGIGTAICQELAKAGHKIVAAYHPQFDNKDEWLKEQEAAGFSGFVCVAGDVSSLEDCQRMVAEGEAAAGPIDILINNAGMQHRGPFAEFPTDAWHRITTTNLDSVFFVGRAVAQRMIPRKAGKIINICSVQSELGRPGIAPYAATKGAVKMLTKGMAIDLGQHGIQVNGLGPGYFKTELNQALVADETFSAWLCKRTPAGRWGEVQELGGAAVFLASAASSFVSGHILYVDGGITASL